MSLPEFQKAFAALVLDARLAQRVREEGEAALASWGLSDREAGRLVRATRQPGMSLNCTLARTNRFAPIAETWPMCCIVIEPRLREVLDALWAEQPPDGYQLNADVERFAQRLQTDSALRMEFPYLDDIFRYESASNSLAYETRRHLAEDMQAKWLEVEMQHDPAQLLGPLLRHQAPPAGLPRRPHRVRIALVDAAIESRWEALHLPTQSGSGSSNLLRS